MEEEAVIRTDDMALVTFLKMNGQKVLRVWWNEDRSQCFWEFDGNTAARELLRVFVSGEALVEPKKYNRTFAEVKREFYQSKPK